MTAYCFISGCLIIQPAEQVQVERCSAPGRRSQEDVQVRTPETGGHQLEQGQGLGRTESVSPGRQDQPGGGDQAGVAEEATRRVWKKHPGAS